MEEIKETVAVEETETKEENVMETIIHDPNAPVVTIKKLLENGVHYGHHTRKWNPKMKKYIFGSRNGLYIIDLNKSKAGIEESYAKLKSIVEEGGKVLIVGTKPTSKAIVENEAIRSGSFYITNRWLGGILTNFKTIISRTKKLQELEANEADGSWDNLPKKEVSALRKEKEKLAKNLEGIKLMRKIPQAIIVVDPTIEYNAVREANKLGIPVFGICDTNCDPDGIDYVIPGNDDAEKSVKLIVGLLCDAIVEAKGGLPEVAFIKQEGEDSTMADAIRQVERENALRMAIRREMLKERLEREKQRQAQYEAKRNANAQAKDGEAKPEMKRKPRKTTNKPETETKAA